jgi:hypothetical protein
VKLLVLAAWFIFPAWPQTAPTIDDILARVQANTGEFESSLPDFVCDERVTSRRITNGKVDRETITESHFAGVQQKTRGMNFSEKREVVSINGAPVSKGRGLSGPFIFGGGFSSVLNQTFSMKYVPFHNYKFAGSETLEDRPVIVIEFATKEGQDALWFDFGGKALVEKDTGKAWVDPQSMQLLRLERRYLNCPSGYGQLLAQVDYGSVSIAGKAFWMPKSVRAESGKKDSNRVATYLAEYSNYRRFDVSSGIKFN